MSTKMCPPKCGDVGLTRFCVILFLIVIVINGIECARNRNKGHTNTSQAIQQHMRFKVPITEKDTDFLNKGKICIGTNGRMSVPSNRDRHYRNLKDRYTNCTYVDGNLELTWLQGVDQDLSFLQHIREVTGYVLISHVDVKKVILPRLQIIRGRNLFKMNMNVSKQEFALIVTLSKMLTLELPALRDVLRGNVGSFNNYNLCHIKTINWTEIITAGNFSYNYTFTSPERQCPPCDRECEYGCWGEGRENCQIFSKVFCSPQCSGGRCFGTKPRECCHLFCAGGCTGPTQSDCIACVNFYDDGVCTQECPPMQIYNPSTYSWEPNPAGKYAYGATCVKKCPEHLLRDNGACVRTCPSNKHAKDGECVPCEGPCPKQCTNSDGTIHFGNIDSFRNCTVLEGNINILQNSLNGYQHVFDNFTFGDRYPPMHPSALEVFSTLKEITGYLNIQADHADFKNLSYFRNLEEIGGRMLYEYSASLYIVKTSLESLELSSLKRIKMGTVAILENPRLCFAGINWKSILKSNESHPLLFNNSNLESCKRRGLVCDPQCSDDGCWGPGPEQCLSCKNLRFGNKCLENCNIKSGLYQASTNECKPCHAQCGSSCHGPGANNCTSCRYLKDGNYCVSKCMQNKYQQNGSCQPCHPNCVESCSGSTNVLGKGGCDACELAIIMDNKDNNYVCLNRKDTQCPDGYYYEYIKPHVSEGSNPNTTAVCRKCHPRCKKCTQYGFHQNVCQECTHYKKGEQCEDECNSDYYPDVATNECIACDSECKGCTGSGNENCSTCQNFKLFYDDHVDFNSTNFICVAQCPPQYPYRGFTSDGGTYCSDIASSQLVASPKNPYEIVIIIAGVVGGLCILMLLVGVFCYYQRKEKIKENAMKMTLALTGLEDNEPLRPTNVMPNVAKLRIIKETELRKSNILGYGAFGKVYQGVWNLEGEGNHHSAKIPVAIKVLREDTGANTSKDFLDEAYIMATVDHPNLLQLLGVCMTSQMMLVTQLMYLGCLLDFVRNNRDRIGSKALLNWSTQIARGMAYLEEKRLVHRDLAARNVLLQTPGCVKITDFGLAKLLDINEEEYKAAGGKMPIKWLALECIQHRIFTHKSDVWAFGVTVWELLTFGERPYDNVPARDVPELLEKGERLAQPEIASIEVYMILIKCWMLDAESRPCFKELEDDFSKMAQDPGRYLAIVGDKFMRLTNFPHPQTDVRSLASAMESSQCTSEGDSHLQPKSRAPLHAGSLMMPSVSPSPTSHSYWPSAQPMTSDGSTSQYQNHLNQKLLRYAQSHGFDSSIPTQSDASSIKYCGNSVKMRDDIGSDEYDSVARSQAKVGTLKLDLPVDEDDYLMPSMQQAQGNTTYVDLIDSKNPENEISNTYTNYQDFYKNNIDNPEYLMNNDAPSQTVGLPTVSEFVNFSCGASGEAAGFKPMSGYLPQKSSEEESDHEYYNDFDRLQRELQPLQKNKDGAIV